MTALIDSDVLIEVAQGRDRVVFDSWVALGRSADVLLCSAVSVAELWQGARPTDHEVIEGVFAALICVPVGQDIGKRAGEYLRQYHKSHALELGDALIGASAVDRAAALWTRNRKHYPMPELEFWTP